MKKLIQRLLYSFFILLSLGQLTRVGLFDQQINLYPHEAIMLLFILAVVIRRRRLSMRLYREIWFFLAVLLVSLVNGFRQYSTQANLAGLLYWLRLGLYFVFFISVRLWLTREGTGGLRILCRGVNVFLILTILLTSLQYLLYPNLRNLSYLGWDPHYYRVFGVFFDTSVMGIVLAMLFIWSFGIELRYRLFWQGLLLVLILLTYSRATYFSLTSAFVYRNFGKVHWKQTVLALLVFGAAIVILPQPPGEGGKLRRTYTISARLRSYREGLALWRKKPFLGFGYNRLRYIRFNALEATNEPNHAGASFPSSYLTILVASGLIGLLSFLVLLYSFFQAVGETGRALILLVGVASLFDNLFLTNFVLILFLMMFAFLSYPVDKSPSTL